MTTMPQSFSVVARPEPVLTDYEPTLGDFRAEILKGLGRRRKRLPCKFFYDDFGSQLFDRICELPEYYQTRTELSIMRRHAAAMSRVIGPGCLLVEYGSGTSLKTRVLLDHLDSIAGYVPIDICRGHVMSSARAIAGEYPGLLVSPVCADYQKRIDIDTSSGNVVAYFPGSTIGNFERADAVDFLTTVRKTCGVASRLLIGVDLKKDPRRLHGAYNDSAGLTAEFNLNMLRRINAELGGDFDPRGFCHYAPYLPADGRVEMHLVSLADQSATVAGRRFDFSTGESIHTESCCKYNPAEFARLAVEAGYRRTHLWVDDEHLFSVQMLVSLDTPEAA